MICELCLRELPESEKSKHHLFTKLKAGAKSPTIELHRICHSKIHSILSEVELANGYNTMDTLRSHPDIMKFIKWVSKKTPNFYDSNKRHNDHKKKRRK